LATLRKIRLSVFDKDCDPFIRSPIIEGDTFKEVASEVMANKIQKELSLKLKKIYPLALCEIRVLELA